ncbi:MAG: hypothetical protein ACQKBV_04950 [Puniceicoccales bacterium]
MATSAGSVLVCIPDAGSVHFTHQVDVHANAEDPCCHEDAVDELHRVPVACMDILIDGLDLDLKSGSEEVSMPAPLLVAELPEPALEYGLFFADTAREAMPRGPPIDAPCVHTSVRTTVLRL